MKGFKYNKGEKAYELIEDSKLLIQELQNFLNISEGDLVWDVRHGLAREILLSRNVDAIKSEVKNKIMEYYGDRVMEVFDLNVEYAGNKVIFTGKIKTIYGSIASFGGERH